MNVCRSSRSFKNHQRLSDSPVAARLRGVRDVARDGRRFGIADHPLGTPYITSTMLFGQLPCCQPVARNLDDDQCLLAAVFLCGQFFVPDGLGVLDRSIGGFRVVWPPKMKDDSIRLRSSLRDFLGLLRRAV
jgi:hypothetical protein